MNEELWNQITHDLKLLLPHPHYQTYFNNLKVTELNKDRVRIVFQSHFEKEQFEEKCLSTLKEVFLRYFLESSQIELEIEKKEELSLPTVIQHYYTDSKYRFDNFIVGQSNQFAHAACVAVSRQPGTCYNPLFIFGGAGLGKTHLIKAIGYHLTLLEKDWKVMYLTSEAFTNELINALKTDRMREFREKYRNGCHVLLLDDVHFFAGKERTQEEFFYTFNFLHEARKQIVITSDRYPKDIQGLENRLKTRFEWGLVADIQPPDVETRMAILQKKAEQSQIVLPDKVAEYIATYVKSNIRELEGALHRLQAYAVLTSVSISLDLAQQVFKDISPKTSHELTPDGIVKLVALHFNVKTIDIKSGKRARTLSYPRQISMYLLRKYLLMSFPEIGKFMGGKDHTTAMHGVNRIADLLRSDPETIKNITAIEGLIR